MLRTLILFTSACLSFTACVERKLTINTVPANADIYLDGTKIGESPLTVPFSHYGTREIVCRKAGFHTMREDKTMEPPYFQEFPWDFYYEALTSDLYTDHRTYEFVMTPTKPDEMTREEVEKAMSRATELRDS